MNTNPYAPPEHVEPVQGDALRIPGIACCVCGVLGLLWAAVLYVAAYIEYRMVQDGHVWTEHPGWQQARAATTMMVISLLALGAAWSIRKRRHRWLVMVAGIAGLLTCFCAPLGAVLLMRLWRKDVWYSFGSTANVTTAPH